MFVSLAAIAAHVPGLTVGIDLGTTNSAVAVLRDGGVPEIVKNRRGDMTTPSVVAFLEGGDVLVGEDALEQTSKNVYNTVHSAKRFIGRPLKSMSVAAKAAGCEVIASADGGCLFNLPSLPQPIAPEEVSAQLLGSLLADAEAATGTRAERAVITVPAYYDEAQRQATMAAAALAGLEQVTLLAEPVAACLAHGISGATGTVLVFDLGAGTFDVSVLRISDGGSVEVVATSGDARLGGNDWDAALLSWLCEESERLGVKAKGDASKMRQLMQAGEAAKKRLSVVKSVEVPLPVAAATAAADADIEMGEGEGEEIVEITLSRERFEKLCDGLFRRLKTPLYEVALSAKITLPGELDPDHGTVKKRLKVKARRKAAKLRPEGRQKYLPTGQQVDEIVLVGGATHMVGVRKLVANIFGVDPRRTVDPMQAVALGAAIQAGVLSGEVRGVRVLQTWQATLSRLLEASGSEEGVQAASRVAMAEQADAGDEKAGREMGAAADEKAEARRAAKQAEEAEEEAAAAAWMARLTAGDTEGLEEAIEEVEEEVIELGESYDGSDLPDVELPADLGVDINALFRQMGKGTEGGAV